MQSLPDNFRAVVIGATGGLGAAFAALLDADHRCGDVIALSRSSSPPVNLEDENSIEAAAEHVKRPRTVHLIIDATGVLSDPAFNMSPEKTIDAVDLASVARAFAVNATGPLLLIKHFYRLMPREGRSIFATISARVGSISDNEMGGWYSYRASKAALNMFVRTASRELARKRPGAVCIALHPGTVDTRLSAPYTVDYEKLTPLDAAQMLLGVIDNTRESGTFRAWDGATIPW